MTRASIWFDGASKGNPGPMAGGAVIEMDGETKILHGVPGVGTNNEAEYHGLILGLKAAAARGAKIVDIRGDSELVIKQLQGHYKVKAVNLRPLYEEARGLLQKFDDATLTWVPRDQNAEADAAANEALGNV